MTPRQLSGYLFLALAWGLSFLVLLRVVAAFGEVGGVTFRCFVAAGTLLALARATGRRLDFRHGPAPYLMLGATTVAGQLLGLNYATPRIGTAMAAIIVATIPLFSMLIARAVGLERLTPARLAGLALGVAGVALLVGFPAQAITPQFLLGCAACAGACLCAASGSVYAGMRMKGVGPFETTIGAFLAGGLICAPFLLVAPVPTTPAPLDYLFLFILGAGMSAATYVVYFRLVAEIGPTRAISVEFAVTAVAVSVGALWLGESLTPAQVAGAGAIVAGCALVLGLVRPRG
ncbi:MAG: DMT family transporter [Rhodoblastus sp.]|nr:MAG: DMT family transporter [Rhodoblastus sp.]